MNKVILAVLAATLLASCASTGSISADEEFLYGRNAGQPMRGAPDSY